MKLSFLLVALLAFQAYAAPPDTSILKTLQSKRSATVIVDVVGSDLKVLSDQVTARSFATRANKLNALYDTLKSHADSKQANILNMLNKEKMSSPIVVEQLWISNQIIVKNADYSVVEKLLQMEEVTSVREERIFPLMEPIEVTVHPEGYVPQAGEQWGCGAINADKVQESGNKGSGVVVATIDTGVRKTHQELRDNCRDSYYWFDPYSLTTEPNDDHGHGTHTMGTIAGKTVGVAPECTWISCKGCDSTGCSEAALLACGQWVACPTDAKGGSPDCSKAPNITSNSWGGGQGDRFYDTTMQDWTNRGICPIFAIGNAGPNCRTANSPGDSTIAIAVGSITSADDLSDFSSVGPTVRGARIKPDVAAPGSNIRSCYHTSDTAYATMSGTSMATPHVAGLAAMLLKQNPGMSVAAVRSALESGARTISKTSGSCGSVPATTYPNHYVGNGCVDAVQSMNIAKAMQMI